MTIDPRTPVIIGAAQVSQRAVDDPEHAPDAIDLMTEAVRAAGADSGANVLDAIDLIAVVGGLWRYRNPGVLIADELGIEADGLLTTFGGNLPIHATAVLGERIASGELDMVVVSGGECNETRRRLAAQDKKPRVREETRADEAESFGPPLDMGDRVAIERGGEIPFNSYAVLDSAIRASRHESLDEARDRAAALWAGYAAVAADNPHAADRRGMSSAKIREPSPTNRMVAWPYTKAMCANNHVDQAAALILCASETADRLGVPEERRVYPHLCVTAHDTLTLVDRENVAEVPGLEAAAAELRSRLGDIDTIDHIDLYSCFPSIVTLTSGALGLTPGRRLTVNGGLAFAGAPLNFAAGQALVAMVHTLRADPGSRGLVQGNGGHATKHALGVYSTTAPERPSELVDLGPKGTPRPIVGPDHVGTGTMLGATVEYDAHGPTRAIAIVEYDDGGRSWANSSDPEIMQLITQEETVGLAVHVEAGEMTLHAR
ncbi:MAG: hypothetical protein R8F63_14490 [Acidimicrobiales bacterium]|nr:hypothetical protein [Acidimicrobiales bacterium]